MRQKLYIECQSKRILATQAYKCVPKEEDVFDEIVLISDDCPNVGCSNQHCKHCKGVCVSVKKEIFNQETGSFEIKTLNLRDKTVMTKTGVIKEVLKASKYIESLNKIFSLEAKEYNPSKNKTTMPWTSYDRPDTWGIDCTKCKENHHAAGELTECELAASFIKDQGVDVYTHPADVINGIELPDKFICKHQKQKEILIY